MNIHGLTGGGPEQINLRISGVRYQYVDTNTVFNSEKYQNMMPRREIGTTSGTILIKHGPL